MSKRISLSVLVLMAGATAAFAGDYETVVDDSVVGYWRFNDPSDYGKDSSGHGSGIASWSDGATGKSDLSRGGGYLNLPKSGSKYGKATATLKGDRIPDLNSATRGWTIATWIRGSEDLINLGFIGWIAVQASEDAKAFYTALTDGKWHPIVVVFRPSLANACYRIYVNPFDGASVTDICSTDDKPGDFPWTFPVSISGTTVTLGGRIAGSGLGYGSLSADFFGDLDDCIIIDRELEGGNQDSTGEHEVFRLVQTGETFVFSKGSSGNMFYEAGNWSNGKVPQTGLAYMIENGHEVKSAKTAIFAGKSLSVGRTEKLNGIKSVGGSKEVIVDNTVGKLTQQGADTTLTVDDLRLNDGILASVADGQSLSANVTVSASQAKPFEINVATGTYRITGSLVGKGYIVKKGAGTLDLSGLADLDAQIVIEEGKVRLPGESEGSVSYSGGELLVAQDAPVAIQNSAAWPVVCTVEGQFGELGSHKLFIVPNSVKDVSATDFTVNTSVGFGLKTTVRVEKGDENQVVWIDVEACDRYVVGEDTFESCTVGDAATAIPGWSGDGTVVAASPSIANPPSYALDGVAHTKVLAVEDSAVRSYADNFARDNQILDVLFQVCRGPLNAAACANADVASGQVSFGVDETGCICIYHPNAVGSGVWSKLSFGTKSAFSNGEWVRLTCVFDYTTNESGDGFVQVRVNGNCGVSSDGVRSPTDETANGSWFRLFSRSADGRKVSRLGVYGDTQLDDIVLSAYKKGLTPETHTGADTEVDFEGTYGSGKTASGKISYAQCDVIGIPRDLNFDSDGDGVSNGVELLKHTDPLDPNSFPGGGMAIIVR